MLIIPIAWKCLARRRVYSTMVSFAFLADGLCRIYGNTVSGVDACTLDVLHDTRNQNVLAVAYCIDLDFFAHQVFINQDRMLLCDLVDDSDNSSHPHR